MCLPTSCEEEKFVKEAKEKADAEKAKEAPKAAAEIDTEADSEVESEVESEVDSESEEGEEKKDEKKECSIPVMMPGCCCKKPLQQKVAEWYCNFDAKCD